MRKNIETHKKKGKRDAPSRGVEEMREGGGGDEADNWIQSWYNQVLPPGSYHTEAASCRPPRPPERRRFPPCLETKDVKKGQKRSAVRCFLYWFPRRGGGVTRRLAGVLMGLRRWSHDERNLKSLVGTIKTVEEHGRSERRGP